ncbi:hypothetical protein DPMN_060043 [Dreissena polymorpha]|uniref:Uncharacterized protein n=1 Tax=Dreissena polymorpha TaxID=45954 RepID=A0A9D4HHS7_DREPO|nr:hypothetical protein DPMN_060043 [Dreissena polymorpha]
MTWGPGKESSCDRKKDRTINARLSPGARPTSDPLYVYHDELRPASVSYCAEDIQQSDGRRPMYMSLLNTLIFADTRTMNPMSGSRQSITGR